MQHSCIFGLVGNDETKNAYVKIMVIRGTRNKRSVNVDLMKISFYIRDNVS